MCSSCRSASQDFDDKQFGTLKDGSMGDAGIAIKNNTKYDGDGGTSEKFEGTTPEKAASAAQVQYSGRQ